MFKSLNNFEQRIYLGLFGICLVAALIFFSHSFPFQYLFVVCVAAVQAAALWEYYTLAIEKGVIPQRLLAVIASIAYTLGHYFSSQLGLQGPLLLFLAVGFMCHFSRYNQAIVNLATTLFGLVYVTVPLSFLIDLNFPSTNSSVWIVYLILTTKMTDTAAYFGGKSLGSRFLAPQLSPKKTLEGAITGLASACLISVLFFVWTQSLGIIEANTFSLMEASFLGIAIGFIAQIGDLAESLLKRDANVKDSSRMPGFGGMLDIVDSLLFTAPLLYFWLRAKGIL